MMSIFTTLIAISATTSAFVSNNKPGVSSFRYVGDIQPVNYFDPLQISDNIDEEFLKYVREAELHHGRVAMVAAITLPLIDLTSDKLAIDYLKDMQLSEQFPFWLTMGLFESARMGAGWKNPFMDRNNYFKLDEHYQPGNVLKVPDDKYSDLRLERELSNGRLAMFASLGYLAQEFVQQQPIV